MAWTVARRLVPYRLCAFASPVYLARRGAPLHPEDLARHDCVNFRYQSSGRTLPWPFRVGERTLEIVPSAAITADVGDAVTAVLSAGGGIGIAATFVAAPYVERGELVPVLSELAVDRSEITALWPESRRGSPNVRAFVALLGELFPSPAPWDVLVARTSRSSDPP
jgi:DNA-binding transcriptional LysR family regulator